MIAVVDVQYVMQNAQATRHIQNAIEAQREIYAKEIATQEAELRTAEQELAQQRGHVAAEVFAERRRSFEERLADVQRKVQDRKRQFDGAFNEAMGKVRDQFLQTVADVAREQSAGLVLSKQTVVIVEKSLDITELVLDRLNRRLPKVVVDVVD